MALVHPLQSSEIDVIGDIHGEIDALRSLLAHLGYDKDGNHPENRKLAFVGDLVDRGPDSIAVFQLVRDLVLQGNAQTILGNHELNLLIPDPQAPSRPKYKHGNHWFHGEPESMIPNTNEVQPQALADETIRRQIQGFLNTLPIALENEHIRIVHACWDPESIAALRNETRSAVEAYQHHSSITQAITRGLKRRDPDTLSKEEKISLEQQLALTEQNQNPVKILTSGKEEPSLKYWAGGRDRFTKRSQWWKTYHDEPFVVFGHYWRTLPAGTDQNGEPIPENKLQIGDKTTIPKIFDNRQPFALLGPRQNCMCIDYSVGRRFWERYNEFPLGSTGTALGALRFHSTNGQRRLSLLFENGEEKLLTKK